MILKKAERRGLLLLSFLVSSFFLFSDVLKNECEPFLLVREEYRPVREEHQPSPPPADSLKTPQTPPRAYRPRPKPAPVELNSADSAALVRVRGIGPYYAARILKFRERLGGFHSPAQLKDMNAQYLVVDSLLQYLTADPSMIKKRLIDTMEFKELLSHPYLEYEDVRLIFNAKRAAGGHISYSLLQEKGVLPPRTLKRIKPYFQ